MEQTAFDVRKRPTWMHRSARRVDSSHGRRLSSCSNAAIVLARVLATGDLGDVMWNQLARVLTVTVRQWTERLYD